MIFTFENSNKNSHYRRSNSLLVVNPTKRRKKVSLNPHPFTLFEFSDIHWTSLQFAEEEGLIYKPLDFEIFGNISAFGIFEISRLAVFEKFLRRTSYLYLHLQMLTEPLTECSSPADTDLVVPKLRTTDDGDVSKVILHNNSLVVIIFQQIVSHVGAFFYKSRLSRSVCYSKNCWKF